MLAVSDNGNFPMVDEEEVTSKKLAPMAKEMIMLIEVLKRNCISPSDSHPPVVITKNMSIVFDNHKFMMVDEEDLIFKKISPMAEEILEMLRVCVPKKIKVSDFVWYNDEIMEHVEKLANGWRTTVSYFVEKEGLGGGGYLIDYVRVFARTDDGGRTMGCLGGGGYLKDYVGVVAGTDDG
ncbi:hypothetical protein Tco_0226629, partial [Tanacetum coccineum]